MTTAAKRKGDKAERELAAIISDQLGVTIHRKLGASHDIGIAFVRRHGGEWIACLSMAFICALLREAMS